MRILLSILIISLTFSSFAQTELVTAFNSTSSGRNVSLSISKTKNNQEIGAGIRYNIGKLAMPDDQNNLYYKRLYPSAFSQYFGLQAFYNRYILKNWEHIKPFLFYNIQEAYSTTRNKLFNLSTTRRYGPFLWLEQYIGLGMKVDLSHNFFLTQKIGVGGMLILGSDKILLKDKVAWEFGSILNVGIGYRF